MPVTVRWAKVTFQFEGLHMYKDAPEEVSFLRTPHRHLFHATVWVQQHHNERDIEYLQFKFYLQRLFQNGWNFVESSCEEMAEQIGMAVIRRYPDRLIKVEVLEDGENGALLEWTR